MRMDVTDVEILSLDSGVITCPVTQDRVPVLFMTIRMDAYDVGSANTSCFSRYVTYWVDLERVAL